MSEKEIRSFLRNDRHDFQSLPLLESEVASDPFVLFRTWFQEVLDAKLDEPYAFSLATTDPLTLQPSLRIVYMRDLRPDGIVFYTNYDSEKGKQLDANPGFSANFFWSDFHRQVRINGKAERLSAQESDTYFNSRPRESKLGAWASHQSDVIEGRPMLLSRLATIEQRFEGQEVPRPDFWGGFLLKAERFEFWQGRENRLHDRLQYQPGSDGTWKLQRLSP